MTTENQTSHKNDTVRIDKFLWAVRIFKTRSLASDACRMGRIMVNNVAVKPSRNIEAGEVLSVKKPPVVYTFLVRKTGENRVGAKLVGDYIEDITSSEEKKKLELNSLGNSFFRKKGTGRPTKKDRRIIDRFQDGFGQ